MLRITPVWQETSDLCLIVEGRVLGPWVGELETSVRQAMNKTSGRVLIDLSAVSYVDSSVVELLRRLFDRGVVLQAASPFVLELLNSTP
ncbi:MAG: STAS domain-containing protein [Gammaproteobacteria bacterium]